MSNQAFERKSDDAHGVVLPRVHAEIIGNLPSSMGRPTTVPGREQKTAECCKDAAQLPRRQYGLLPQSRLFIPKASSLTPLELYEEQCKHVPNKQIWGVAWLNKTPIHPDDKYDSFVVVLLKTFALQRKAIKYKTLIMRKYPGRSAIIFRMGYWLTLPIPQWLTTDKAIIKYNEEAGVALIKNDARNTKIKHEIVKRRTKRSNIDTSYLEPEEETLRLEPDGQAYVAPSESKQHETSDGTLETGQTSTEEVPPVEDDSWERAPIVDTKSTWLVPKDITSESHPFGLLWVLPDIQAPGQFFKNIAFAWLGAYENMETVETAQAKIKESHPSWSVTLCEMGTPLQIPIPTWLLQQRQQILYDQPILSEFMQQGQHYVGPEELGVRLEEMNTQAEAAKIGNDVLDDTDMSAQIADIAGPEGDSDDGATIDDEKEYEVVNITRTTTGDKSIQLVAKHQREQKKDGEE